MTSVTSTISTPDPGRKMNSTWTRPWAREKIRCQRRPQKCVPQRSRGEARGLARGCSRSSPLGSRRGGLPDQARARGWAAKGRGTSWVNRTHQDRKSKKPKTTWETTLAGLTTISMAKKTSMMTSMRAARTKEPRRRASRHRPPKITRQTAWDSTIWAWTRSERAST